MAKPDGHTDTHGGNSACSVYDRPLPTSVFDTAEPPLVYTSKALAVSPVTLAEKVTSKLRVPDTGSASWPTLRWICGMGGA